MSDDGRMSSEAELLAACRQFVEQLPGHEHDLLASFDEALVPLMLLAPERRIWRVNHKFTELFGYTAEDIPTLSAWFELTVPEERRQEVQARWEERLKRAREGLRAELLHRCEIRCKDGTTRTVEGICSAFGEWLLFFFVDLTEKLWLEDELHWRDSLLHSVMNAMPEGMILFDEEGAVIEWNPAYARSTGISVQDALGQKCWDLQFRALPEEMRTPEMYERIKGVLQRFFQTGELPERLRFREIVVERMDSEKHFLQFHSFPIKTPRGYMLGGIAHDVTQRRRNEVELARYREQLEKQNQELRQLAQAIRQSGSTIVITDLDSCVVYANPKFEETTGYTVEEVLGKNLRFMQSGAHPKSYYEQLWRTLKAKQEWRGEFLNRRKDGSLYWEYATIAPIFDDDGNVTHYIAVKEDITARKQAEAEVQLLLSLTRGISEARDFLEALEIALRLVGEHTGWVLGEAWIPDPHGILLKNSGVTYLSRPEDESLQKFAQISMEFSFPMGVGVPGRIWASGEPEWQEDISVLGEETYLRVKYARLAGLKAALGVPIIADEEVLAVLVFYTDHSQVEELRLVELVSSVALQLGAVLRRKQVEEENLRLTTAVEQSASTVVITDKQGTITYVNPKFTQLTGYTFEEALGQNPRILKAKETPLTAEDYRNLWRTILSGQSWHGEFCNQKKNGELFWESAIISPIRNLRGEITHFIAIKEDITARKKAEEQLREYAAMLEEQNAELDAFAHTVAHDLKNPLTIVMGFSLALESKWQEFSPQRMDQYLHTISENTKRMNNIIDELLLLASVRGLEGVELQPLEMQSLVDEAMQRLTYMSEERHAEIEYPDRWPTAMGYGPWVLEVWTNYISNAIKYGGTPPHIEVGATELEHTIRFWVKDNGPGLTESQQKRLFVPFERFHQVRARGHGLGLSIVRRIVERLGGEVGAENAPEGGSIFYFTLPKAAESD